MTKNLIITPDDAIKALDDIPDEGEYLEEDNTILFQGSQFILPKGINARQGAKVLLDWHEAQEELVTRSEVFNYHPYDGAFCTWRAFKRVFNIVGHNGTMGFFGPTPPKFLTVPTGPNTTEQVPWGELSVPVLPGVSISLGATNHEDYGTVFKVTITAPRKAGRVVRKLWALIRRELETASLYRGRIITAAETPQFLDYSDHDPAKVVYNDDIARQLERKVWTVLRNRELYKEQGLSTKRAVVFSGDFGTGKTLAAKRTAQIAEETGTTFIQVRAGEDSMVEAFRRAELYEPAVVFVEDVDTLIDPSNLDSDQLSQLLDMFDGATAKGRQLMVVMTTNHPDRFHAGMLRPGRINAFLEFKELEPAAQRTLIEANAPAGMLAPDIEWDRVLDELEGFTPAFIVEATEQAYREMVETPAELRETHISTDLLIECIRGLRPQLERMRGAKTEGEKDRLDALVSKVVRKALAESHDPNNRPDNLFTLNEDTLQLAKNGH